MIGFDAVVSTLRKPAMALLAAAGLVMGAIDGGAATELSGGVAVPTEALSAPDHVRTPALAQAAAASLLLADAGERPQTRAPGGDRGLSRHRVPSGLAMAVAAIPHPRGAFPLHCARPGRESAPTTGPPSFLS